MSITSVGPQSYTSYSRKTEEVNESRTKRVDNEAEERGPPKVDQVPSTQTVDPCKGCSGKGSRLDAFL